MTARASAVAPLVAAISLLAAAFGASSARAEAILQFFETPWAEVEARMPEIAAAGYDAIWLPPPTKGTEGLRDVGFALYDRFDLGDRFQRGTVATRYGSKEDLLALTDTAHRFGVRVYFDVIMNHNGNPSTIENVGVDIDMVDLDGWPGMSPWDFHVLPAKQAPLGDCAGPPTCQFCAFQPTHDPPQNTVGIADFRVVEDDLSLREGGWNVCINPSGGEQRVATMTIEDALLVNGGDDVAASAILDGYVDDGFTHIVSAPWWDFGGGKKFEEMNWTLLGLFDIATEQYPDYVDGVHAWDGHNAVNGLPLPSFVRHPGRPELYPDVASGAALPDEDVREMQMRWIRWLMLEAKADGFRLDAIKHVYPNFYGEDFPGDPIAFNAVIQDTYDEVHGNSDVDDADLIDDAAIFGEAFTGSCDELKPYIDTGMRALDFPLFNALGQLNAADNDIGQLSARRPGGGCDDVNYGAFGGLNRRSGVAFAHSHDECQKHEYRTTDDWANPEFSRCFPQAGNPDLIYAFLLTRDADATVFFDGNNWTNQSFVRSGRPDALGDAFGGGPQRVVVELVDAHRRVARGTRTDALNQRNVWVGSDAYAYERIVDGLPAGLVVLDDRQGRDATFGNDSQSGSFIVTSFAAGTVLVELTGNALEWARTVTVLDPDVVDDNAAEAPEVNAARDNYAAANGAQPPAGYGIVYTGFPGGRYVVYAPEAVRSPVLGVQVEGAAAATTMVTTASDKVLPDGITLVTDASVEMFVVPAGATFTLTVSTDEAVTPTTVAAQLDGDPALLPGTALTSTSERFLDGFKPLSAGSAGAYSLANISTAGVTDGVHGVRVRFARDIAGAAQAQDEIVLPLCVGTAAACEPREPSFPEPPEVDAGPDPVDDAGPDPEEDSGQVVVDDAGPRPDAGEGEDAGSIDPGADDDGDDVINAEDNCPFEQNREQADFDEDGVGDVCDLCPVGVRGRPVDSDGCPLPTEQERALIDDIARAIAEHSNSPSALDLDQSGVIDVSDLDIAIGRAHVSLAHDGGTP